MGNNGKSKDKVITLCYLEAKDLLVFLKDKLSEEAEEYSSMFLSDNNYEDIKEHSMSQVEKRHSELMKLIGKLEQL